MSVATVDLYQELLQLPGLTVRRDEPMARHTSFGIGGPADLFVMPADVPALAQLVAYLAGTEIEALYIGNGTNLLVKDGGIRGVVVKIAGALMGIKREGKSLIVGAGESLAAVCHYAAQQGLAGLEFAAGIPGTVGGAIVMNAGANGGEMAKVLDWVEVIDKTGQIACCSREELDFDYRQSQFQYGDWIITKAAVSLRPSAPSAVHQSLYEAVETRCRRQPVSEWSAGCIFKHPPGDYAGRLLEETDGKGMRVGGAMISRKHANFIVNTGNATAADVIELIRRVQDKVEAKFGVRLDTEICICGEDVQ